ncbi:phage terminase large subunit family protein [Escherichia coli]|nr:phage terminase large subunit family protein [Escherichia coli]
MNQVNESHSRASDIWREVASLFRPPSRLPVAEAIRRYMRVPRGANTSGPWESSLTPYMIDPINTLSAREYDAVVFVGPARTGKTEGLIDGWIVYGIICDPADMLVVQMTETKAREHSRTRLSGGRFATVRRSASASVLPVMTTTSTIKCFLTAPS